MTNTKQRSHATYVTFDSAQKLIRLKPPEQIRVVGLRIPEKTWLARRIDGLCPFKQLAGLVGVDGRPVCGKRVSKVKVQKDKELKIVRVGCGLASCLMTDKLE